MSYCRFHRDSDVYVYNNGKTWQCWSCSPKGSSYHTETPGEMADHLEEHRKSGDKVPQTAIDRLKEEQNEI